MPRTDLHFTAAYAESVEKALDLAGRRAEQYVTCESPEANCDSRRVLDLIEQLKRECSNLGWSVSNAIRLGAEDTLVPRPELEE